MAKAGQARIAAHGPEQEPVVVIDHCAPDPDALIAHACRLDYGRDRSRFPGLRAAVPAEMAQAMLRSAMPVLRDVFKVPSRPMRMEAFFSLITTPAGALDPIQRLPHFDGVGRNRVAFVHHLGRQAKGGTAFYRHRSTGYALITADRLKPYNEAVNGEIRRHGMPPARYASCQTPFYEQIAFHPAGFNTMLIYRGAGLHSAEVPDDVELTDDPRTGRLSINTFLWWDEPAA